MKHQIFSAYVRRAHAAVAVVVVLAGLMVSQTAQAVPSPSYTNTSSEENFASLEILSDSETTSTFENPVTGGTPRRLHINETGVADWLYVDATGAVYNSLWYESCSGAGFPCPSYAYKRYGANNPPNKHYYLNNVKYNSTTSTYDDVPDVKPISGTGSDVLPGNGGSVAKVSVYDLTGNKVPNAAFRAELWVKSDSGAYEVAGDPGTAWQTGGAYGADRTAAYLSLFHCDPKAGTSCTPVSGSTVPGGTNPVRTEGRAVFVTDANGDAWIWFGHQNTNLSGEALKILDFRAGDTVSDNTLNPNQSDPRTFVAAGAMTASGATETTFDAYDLAGSGSTVATKATKTYTARSGLTSPDPITVGGTPADLFVPVSTLNFRTQYRFTYATGGTCLWGSTIVDPAQSTFESDETDVVADGTSTVTLTVTLKNMCGTTDNMSGKSVYIDVLNPDGTYSTRTITTGAGGVGTTTVTAPTTTGSDVDIKAHLGTDNTGAQIDDPVTINYTEGPPDATESDASLDDDEITADGSSTATITVELKDAQGRPIPAGAKVCIEQSDGTGTLSSGPWTTDANGKVTATVTAPTTPGSGEFKVYLGECSSKGGEVGTLTVDYVPGDPTTGNSTMDVDDNEITADGTEKSTLSVELKDANGNPVAAGTQVCVELDPGDGTLPPGPWTADKDGKLSVEITSTKAGTDTLNVYLGSCDSKGAKLGDETITYVPGPADAPSSSIEADKKSMEPDGKNTSTVTVTVKDANGNPVPAGTAVCMELSSGTGSLSTGPWVTDANGQVTAVLTAPNENGSGTVSGYLGDCSSKGAKIGDATVNYSKPSVTDQSATSEGGKKVTLTPSVKGTPSAGATWDNSSLKLYDPKTKTWATSVKTKQGTWTVKNGKVEFTPASGFSGVATLSFQLSDTNAMSAEGELSVTVTAATETDSEVESTGTLPATGGNSMAPAWTAMLFLLVGWAMRRRRTGAAIRVRG